VQARPKKRFFAKHSKSSAMVISLAIHAVLIVVALSYVAVTVIQKDDNQFEAKPVVRPEQPPKKLKVPVKVTRKMPKPKMRKRLVAKKVDHKVPDFKMPEITGVKDGLGAMGGDEGTGSIGFSVPEIEFFGTKASGEKVVFVVHFGPATIGIKPSNSFTRMTGYTIRKRLEDMVNKLPDYTLFNVIAYYSADACAIHPSMLLASSENKQKVRDWMEPVNPLKGKYSHCFAWTSKAEKQVNKSRQYQSPAEIAIDEAKGQWPTRVDDLPFYSMKWAYPYVVPRKMEKKYVPTAKSGFVHWGRGVAWAILEQKADTIFVLTTNYIDGWGVGSPGGQQPVQMTAALKKMCIDVYGTDKEKWPTINFVVLAKTGKGGAAKAEKVLKEQFGPVYKGFRSEGSIIDDITEYMTDDEQDLLEKYRDRYEK
jgi:hypothetical protein